MTMRILTLATVAVFLVASPVAAKCIMSYCRDDAPSRTRITNEHRQILGDLYDPGRGRRIQIRDNDRRILGYVERSGKITDPDRREVGSIESLGFTED